MKCRDGGVALLCAFATSFAVLTVSQGNSATVNLSTYCSEAETADIKDMEAQEALCLRQFPQLANRKGTPLCFDSTAVGSRLTKVIRKPATKMIRRIVFDITW